MVLEGNDHRDNLPSDRIRTGRADRGTVIYPNVPFGAGGVTPIDSPND